jgi:hypothetical protein
MRDEQTGNGSKTTAHLDRLHVRSDFSKWILPNLSTNRSRRYNPKNQPYPGAMPHDGSID